MRGTLCLLLIFVPAAVLADEDIADYLQSISVTVRAGGSGGSGVLVSREIDGKPRTLALTAAHVVDGLRRVSEVIDPRTGRKRHTIKYDDARIIREFIQSGRRVGESQLDAKVLQVSKAQDVAVLLVRKQVDKQASARFLLGDTPPKIGSYVYHVGSMGGQPYGANSMTAGIVAHLGRVIDEKQYDQIDATASPGSSGGGVFLKDGQCIGVLTMGIRGSDNFNFIVPIRVILKWAGENELAWVFDPAQKPPTMEQLKKLPVESVEGAPLVEPEPTLAPTLRRFIIRYPTATKKLEPKWPVTRNYTPCIARRG